MTAVNQAFRADAYRDTLLTAFGSTADIRVAPDDFKGYRVYVRSAVFRDLDRWTRVDMVRNLIPDGDIAHLVLLDPDEDERDISAETSNPLAPIWPESLRRGESREHIVLNLPSKLDIVLSPPVFATFYSLRGGVGRSTALAYTARRLSENNRVICVDMDLEAPGLGALFDVESSVKDGSGVVDWLLRTEISMEAEELAAYLVEVGESGNLYLLPAGKPGADYARKLAQLDPAAWTREESNPLHLLRETLRSLEVQPDVVLFDSRTGISPIAAPLLFELSDIAIIGFFPHPQGQAGTEALTRALLASRTIRSTEGPSVSPEPRFIVSPVPSHAADDQKRYEDRALDWIAEWLRPARNENGDAAFEDLEEITQVIPYSDAIAASDSVFQWSGGKPYDAIAGWIAGFVAPHQEVENAESGLTTNSAAELKNKVLSSLRFSTGTAEAQTDTDFDESFLQTDVVDRAMRSDVPIVLGRKGTGKTALFRRLAQQQHTTVVTSPPGLSTAAAWMPDSEAYKAIGDFLVREDIGWRSVWPLLIGIALKLKHKDALPSPWWAGSAFNFEGEVGTYSRLDLVRDIRQLLSGPDAALEAQEWLGRIDRVLAGPELLLFDGLDTGFGLDRHDLVRRRDGISGLLNVVMAQGQAFERLTFKVMLREDIWRDVPVPNKSHFYGREVRLAWLDQTDYLRVVIKQAYRSEPFRNLVNTRFSRRGLDLSTVDVQYWPSAVIYEAWIALVGERVSGGKTAFTYNWVWSRLSDGNADHSPRSVLQLFNEAVRLEDRLNNSNPYERSILRPRALVDSLDAVSREAITALREEFSELEPLFLALESLGITPFAASELSVGSDVETLAREVGLLSIDVGSRDEVERYRVPELYRKALGMGRRGQA